jgi:hypothetical protein
VAHIKRDSAKIQVEPQSRIHRLPPLHRTAIAFHRIPQSVLEEPSHTDSLYCDSPVRRAICEAVKSSIRYRKIWRSCLFESLARFAYRLFLVMTADYRHPHILNWS